jgi:uncharacterized protein YxeA
MKKLVIIISLISLQGCAFFHWYEHSVNGRMPQEITEEDKNEKI